VLNKHSYILGFGSVLLGLLGPILVMLSCFSFHNTYLQLYFELHSEYNVFLTI